MLAFVTSQAEATLREWGAVGDILLALGAILDAIGSILVTLASVLFTAPVFPLLVWVALWLFAVDWTRLRQIMLKGGWLGVVLVGAVMVIVWQQVSPGASEVLGLKTSGYVEKFVYVAGLFSVMFLCGAVQLTGCCRACCPAPAAEADSGDSHGH